MKVSLFAGHFLSDKNQFRIKTVLNNNLNLSLSLRLGHEHEFGQWCPPFKKYS